METATVSTKFFMNKKGERLTLEEIIEQKKKVNFMTLICPPKKTEEKLPGIKGVFGGTKEVLKPNHPVLDGDIQIEMDNGFVKISMPFTAKNLSQYTNILECASAGIKKELISGEKSFLVIFITKNRISKICWE